MRQEKVGIHYDFPEQARMDSHAGNRDNISSLRSANHEKMSTALGCIGKGKGMLRLFQGDFLGGGQSKSLTLISLPGEREYIEVIK